jgi:hypothetical protein
VTEEDEKAPTLNWKPNTTTWQPPTTKAPSFFNRGTTPEYFKYTNPAYQFYRKNDDDEENELIDSVGELKSIESETTTTKMTTSENEGKEKLDDVTNEDLQSLVVENVRETLKSDTTNSLEESDEKSSPNVIDEAKSDVTIESTTTEAPAVDELKSNESEKYEQSVDAIDKEEGTIVDAMKSNIDKDDENDDSIVMEADDELKSVDAIQIDQVPFDDAETVTEQKQLRKELETNLADENLSPIVDDDVNENSSLSAIGESEGRKEENFDESIDDDDDYVEEPTRSVIENDGEDIEEDDGKTFFNDYLKSTAGNDNDKEPTVVDEQTLIDTSENIDEGKSNVEQDLNEIMA